MQILFVIHLVKNTKWSAMLHQNNILKAPQDSSQKTLNNWNREYKASWIITKNDERRQRIIAEAKKQLQKFNRSLKNKTVQKKKSWQLSKLVR